VCKILKVSTQGGIVKLYIFPAEVIIDTEGMKRGFQVSGESEFIFQKACDNRCANAIVDAERKEINRCYAAGNAAEAERLTAALIGRMKGELR
jgi:hypothetical protein